MRECIPYTPPPHLVKQSQKIHRGNLLSWFFLFLGKGTRNLIQEAEFVKECVINSLDVLSYVCASEVQTDWIIVLNEERERIFVGEIATRFGSLNDEDSVELALELAEDFKNQLDTCCLYFHEGVAFKKDGAIHLDVSYSTTVRNFAVNTR